MPVKFEQNRMVQTKRNFEFFDKKQNKNKKQQKKKKKKRFFITIFDKELTPFWKTFL